MKGLKEIWSYKWIYFSSLSTIYDQATDIGVLIYWYSLIDNNDIKHVDMMLLFALSCVFIVISRLVNIYLGVAVMKSTLLGMFLGLFDLLIMTLVWGKISGYTNLFDEMEHDQDELSQISFFYLNHYHKYYYNHYFYFVHLVMMWFMVKVIHLIFI